MERRVLLAVTLSFLVLVLYQQWIGPPPAVDRVGDDPVAGTAVGTGVPGPSSAGAAVVDRPGAAAPPGASVDPPPPAGAQAGEPVIAVVADDRQRTVLVESDFVLAEFDNRGA
ncbi:MAG: hypothetical protein OXG35_30470, partial [Acidobacteria bacterium]|nr:hypothetical protein [Acidobacteriota bacterium]